MKLIIAGSRDIDLSYDELFNIIDKFNILYDIKEVVCGEAKGVDSNGHDFAKKHGIMIKSFPADWAKYGGLAGPRRNREMAVYADALLIIWDGRSRGSANMKARMKGMGKTIFEVVMEKPNV